MSAYELNFNARRLKVNNIGKRIVIIIMPLGKMVIKYYFQFVNKNWKDYVYAILIHIYCT